MTKKIKQVEEVKTKSELVKVKPLKDFKIRMNEFSYNLEKGKELEVHKMFLSNLKTEKVIKE